MTHPDTLKRLLARTAARKAAGLIPSARGRTPQSGLPVPAPPTAQPPIPYPERYAPTTDPDLRVMLPCRHLGGPTGEKTRCGSCRSTVYLKVFSCAVLGTCTVGKPVPGVSGCCRECTRYEAPPEDAPARPLPAATALTDAQEPPSAP